MLAGRFGKRSDTTIKPIETKSNHVRLKPLFAPNHSPEMEIMKQMAKAKERIDFAIFTFSESSVRLILRLASITSKFTITVMAILLNHCLLLNEYLS